MLTAPRAAARHDHQRAAANVNINVAPSQPARGRDQVRGQAAKRCRSPATSGGLSPKGANTLSPAGPAAGPRPRSPARSGPDPAVGRSRSLARCRSAPGRPPCPGSPRLGLAGCRRDARRAGEDGPGRAADRPHDLRSAMRKSRRIGAEKVVQLTDGLVTDSRHIPAGVPRPGRKIPPVAGVDVDNLINRPNISGGRDAGPNCSPRAAADGADAGPVRRGHRRHRAADRLG